jgi:cell division protein FtsI/penicillin-binding protein 2
MIAAALAMMFVLNVDVNYVAIDVRSREVIARDWADAEVAIPVGSLVKPFTALAYPGEFPEFDCKGAAGRCWLARGHGRIEFREALADSCNAYFLNLARGVDAETLAVVAGKFGIAAPSEDNAETRIGLGRGWKISPFALAGAYRELVERASEPRVAEILAGMKLAAEAGTAKALGRGVLAKTGTAPGSGHVGDGFTVVLDPAEAPRIVLLVRVRGVPGAEAAKTAARILREVRERR